MNMLLRFFIMTYLLKQELKKHPSTNKLTTETLSVPIIRRYRILPHDMGFRDHLPNYRYLSFIELNITQWLAKCCHYKDIEPLKWVLAMQEMIYLKPIKFLHKITLNSVVAGWDQKYIYFEHRFFVKNQLMGVGMSKFVLEDRKGKRYTPEVLDMTGEQLTATITTWNQHQIAVKSKVN